MTRLSRPPVVARVVLSLLAVPVAAVAAGPARAQAPTPTASSEGRLVRILAATPVSAHPDAAAPRVAHVAPRRPVTGGPTVLPVLAEAADADGARWLQVLLPGRPNGRAGWIRARGTRPDRTRWQLEVHLDRRRVVVLRDGRPFRAFTGIVGAPVTPTPTGRFFVEEVVQLSGREVGAPYALALSARSSVLRQFAGGPGQIALHGRDNAGGIPGTAVSHGCIRLSTAAITWLAERIRPGVRVTITR